VPHDHLELEREERVESERGEKREKGKVERKEEILFHEPCLIYCARPSVSTDSACNRLAVTLFNFALYTLSLCLRDLQVDRTPSSNPLCL
jgi:hypothetical protein